MKTQAQIARETLADINQLVNDCAQLINEQKAIISQIKAPGAAIPTACVVLGEPGVVIWVKV